MKLELMIDTVTDKDSLGKLYIDGKYFCETLEDTIRDLKVYGETAIPCTTYSVTVTYSNAFKKELPLIFNKADFSIEYKGLSFQGVRFHGGNSAENSLGCVLVAGSRSVNKFYAPLKAIRNTIFGSKSDELTKILKGAISKGESILLHKTLI